MPAVTFFDRVFAATATTGTGAITPGAAVGPFLTFAAVPAGAVFPYLLTEGANWEQGLGTMNADGTITRAIRKSTATNNGPIALAGNGQIAVVPASADVPCLSSSLAQNFQGPVTAPTLTASGSLSAGNGLTVTAGHSNLPSGYRLTNSGDTALQAVTVGAGLTVTGGHTVLPSGYRLTNNGDTTLQAVTATSVTIGSGVLSLTGGTNTIVMSNAGLGAPTVGSRSAGAKIVLIDQAGPGTPDYAIGVANDGTVWNGINGAAAGWAWYANTTAVLKVSNSGVITPGSDNATSLGSSSFRWSTIYAGTGSINTSDATLKTVRPGGMTDAERTWARSIRICAGQFNDAVAQKGADKARLHWWVIAQDIHAAGLAAGIVDPMHYAFLCRDPLTQTEKQTATVQRQATQKVMEEQDRYEVADGRAVLTRVHVEVERPLFDTIPVVDAAGQSVMQIVTPEAPAIDEVRDDEGAIVTPATPAQPAVYAPATYRAPRMIDVTEERDVTVPVLDETGAPVLRWGIRYDELAMFLLAADRETAA